MTDAFLDAHGFGAAARAALPGDASGRRYTRLLGGPDPALLMESPEPVAPFVAVARHIASLGLSAPRILAEDAAQGLLLIEDFGDATHAALLDADAVPGALYAEAVAALAVLHEAPPHAGLPAWDAAAMARATAATFLDWWWPEALGRPPSTAQRAGLDQALHAVLAPFAAQGFVHRDYFPANLMRLEDRDGARRCGIIDFQDAALGHPAYDLVSLLEDARRDVAPGLRAAMVGEYLARRRGLDQADFRAAMAVCAAQRHLRVAALWVRLDRRDGKPHYLVHGPRCWALLEAALAHPATRPLREFLDAHVPRERRGNPAGAAERDEA
ncbi:aminoglycoside phosphotransferase family protein [Plastoroseomonas arctica]|uniref:aminoglycoside phosphotransferase family protein n=1 Tax=Plastoroseomonas arctica TaxID=1509237 RepID=UPI003462653F